MRTSCVSCGDRRGEQRGEGAIAFATKGTLQIGDRYNEHQSLRWPRACAFYRCRLLSHLQNQRRNASEHAFSYSDF